MLVVTELIVVSSTQCKEVRYQNLVSKRYACPFCNAIFTVVVSLKASTKEKEMEEKTIEMMTVLLQQMNRMVEGKNNSWKIIQIFVNDVL